MRQRIAPAALLILIGLIASCGKGTQPTQPTTTVTSASPGSPGLVDLRVSGPASVPPGESAQFAAKATYSDGTSRDVSTEARWSSSDDSVLSVSPTGAITARANGEADVQAALGTLVAGHAIVVVPAGRYRLKAVVTEDQITAPLFDVHVEVISDPAAGLAASTDWAGRATLFGVPQDVQLRFTKGGYEPLVLSVHVADNYQQIYTQLLPSQGRIDLRGQYQLTISSGACAGGGGIPEAVKTRTYVASVSNSGLRLNVALLGPNFAVQWCPICGESRGNAFTGQPEALDARFTLIEYGPPDDWGGGIYPNVVERLSDGRLLSISGHAIVAPTAQGFSGTLDGTIAIYDWLELIDYNHVGRVLASCQSRTHAFSLVR